MIKLPIMLAEHETIWQDAVRDALLRRTQLEAEAAHEPQYVRHRPPGGCGATARRARHPARRFRARPA